MSVSSKDAPAVKLWNVPNQITAVRLVLSIVVFVLIGWEQYLPALVVFLIAASTDWVDGYWARKYNQVTKVGRVFDPFVDKMIICGTFIVLAAVPHSGISSWIAVIVIGRELLVTSLRSFIEKSGGDFSANQAGKWKMVFQCAAVVASLLALMIDVSQRPVWLDWALPILVWIAVLSTLYSGIVYLFAAADYFRE